jgi:hypothetical protein
LQRLFNSIQTDQSIVQWVLVPWLIVVFFQCLIESHIIYLLLLNWQLLAAFTDAPYGFEDPKGSLDQIDCIVDLSYVIELWVLAVLCHSLIISIGLTFMHHSVVVQELLVY